MADKKSIFIVMGECADRALLVDALSEKKITPIIAGTADEVRLKFSVTNYSHIFLDSEMPNDLAEKFIVTVRKKEEQANAKRPINITVLGPDAQSYYQKFQDFDDCRFLAKPIEPSELQKHLMSMINPSSVMGDKLKTLKPGERLIEEGEESLEMYWVVKGKFSIYKETDSGKKIMIGEVGSGELLGEMSFLDSLPRSATVEAIEDSEVLTIPYKKFVDRFDGQPAWFRSLVRTLSQRLRSANKIIARKQAFQEPEESETLKNKQKVEGY